MRANPKVGCLVSPLILVLFGILVLTILDAGKKRGLGEVKGTVVEARYYDNGAGLWPLYVVQLGNGTNVTAKPQHDPQAQYKVGDKVILEVGQTFLLGTQLYWIE